MDYGTQSHFVRRSDVNIHQINCM